MSGPVFDLRKALMAHDEATEYAVRVQAASSSKQSVARSALSVLAHESVCLHRAIEALGREGWAFAAPILMRSTLDLALSALVIVNADRPDVAAFEYFYAFTKGEDYRSNPKAQEETAVSVRTHLEQMTSADRDAASAFLVSSKAGAFWYSDRFRGPSDVIQAYGTAELRELWRRLSSSTHGGYFGMRTFRADPFRLNINPRKDPQTGAMAVLGSTTVLVELLNIWERFIGVPSGEYQRIKGLVALAGTAES